MGLTNLDTSKAKQTCLLGLEIFVHLVSVVAIDVGFGHQWESNTMVHLAKGGNGLIVPRFLTVKLVAREAENNKAFILILVVEALEAFVLGGESAFGSNVHDQHNLSLELFEIVLFVAGEFGFEVVQLGHFPG